jgi:hypothetical protein
VTAGAGIVDCRQLASTLEISMPSKSLHRMFSPHGNPSTKNFFGILSVLQKKTRVKLRVSAKAA